MRDFPTDIGYYIPEVIAMANVGKNIRNMRNKNKMTQDELAEKLFVSRQTVSNYETGKSNPDIDMLIKIAEVLNTDVNILIFGIPTPPDKKREYRKLAVNVLIVLLLGIFITIARPRLNAWSGDTFHTGLTVAFQLTVYPAFLFSTGFCIMQAAGGLFGAKPLSGRIPGMIHYLIILLLVIYAVLVLPFCITEIQYALKLLGHIHMNGGTAGTFSLPYTTDRPFQRLAYDIFCFLYYFRLKYSPVYGSFLLGAAFWGTKPVRAAKSSADKKASPPNPDTPR